MSRYSNYAIKNNVFGVLSTPISSLATTIQLEEGQGARFSTNMLATLENIESGKVIHREIVLVTAINGDVLTVTRKVAPCPASDDDNSQGQVSFAFTTGDTISAYIDKEHFDKIDDSINDIYDNGVNKLRTEVVSGLQIKVNAGPVLVGSGYYDFAGGNLTLTDNATNYIEIDQDGDLTVNTTTWNDKSTKISKVITSGGQVVNIEDWRLGTVGGEIGGVNIHELTEKTDLSQDDELIISDSDNIYNNKKITAKDAIFKKIYNYIYPIDNSVQKGKFAMRKNIESNLNTYSVLSSGQSYYIQRFLNASGTQQVNIVAGKVAGSGKLGVRLLDGPSPTANELDDAGTQTLQALTGAECHGGTGSGGSSGGRDYTMGGACFKANKNCVWKSVSLRNTKGGTITQIRLYKGGTSRSNVPLYREYNNISWTIDASGDYVFDTPVVLQEGEFFGYTFYGSRMINGATASGSNLGDTTFCSFQGASAAYSGEETGSSFSFGGANYSELFYCTCYGINNQANYQLSYSLTLPDSHINKSVYLELYIDETDTQVLLGGANDSGLSLFYDGSTLVNNGFDVYITVFGYGHYYTLAQPGGQDYQYIVSDKIDDSYFYGKNSGTIDYDGLSVGKKYYIDVDGTISQVGGGYCIGYVINGSKLLLQNDDNIYNIISSYSLEYTQSISNAIYTQTGRYSFDFTTGSNNGTIVVELFGNNISQTFYGSHITGYTTNYTMQSALEKDGYIYVLSRYGQNHVVARVLVEGPTYPNEKREIVHTFTYDGGSFLRMVGIDGENIYFLYGRGTPSNNADKFFKINTTDGQQTSLTYDLTILPNYVGSSSDHSAFVMLPNRRIVVQQYYKEGDYSNQYNQNILIFNNPEEMELISIIPLNSTNSTKVLYTTCINNYIYVWRNVLYGSNNSQRIGSPKIIVK